MVLCGASRMSTIIVLNGTSSSGKTSIARAFQEQALPRIFLNISIDTILYALPQSAFDRIKRGDDISDLRLRELVRAFYATVKTLASLGHDLVVDHAVVLETDAEMLQDAVRGHRVLLVGLECPAEILEEREKRRGDRRPGLAAAQHDKIHRWLRYDLVIDTSDIAAEDAARRIAAALESRMAAPGEYVPE